MEIIEYEARLGAAGLSKEAIQRGLSTFEADRAKASQSAQYNRLIDHIDGMIRQATAEDVPTICLNAEDCASVVNEAIEVGVVIENPVLVKRAQPLGALLTDIQAAC